MDCYQDAEGGWFRIVVSDDGTRSILQNGTFELQHELIDMTDPLFCIFRKIRMLKMNVKNDLKPGRFHPLLI
jgi:hypothetical protein